MSPDNTPFPEPVNAHRHPIITPDPSESLESFLERAAPLLAWPGYSRGEDLAMLASLLGETAPGPRGVEFAAYILRALSFTADPPMALRHLDRYVRAQAPNALKELERLRDNSEHLHFLCSLFSFSTYLSEVVIRHPDFLPWIMRKSRLNRETPLMRYRDRVQEWMTGVTGRTERVVRLTLFKQRELLRIGIRDLLELGGTRELCRELSNLAQAIIEVAHADVNADLRERFGTPRNEVDHRETGYCIYAMGKFGAGELNFSSDVDLIFLYDEEGETEGSETSVATAAGRRITNHEFFNRVSREIVQYLSVHNREGFLFRVDARLRPEGAEGPLARSRPAYVAYLKGHAALWEKIAYLKARFIAGDESLAILFDPIVREFVYTDNVDSELLPEVARLKRRIDHEALAAESRELDIKRGRGGIREIEFIVAAMQLLHGQTNQELRVRPTLDALHLLVKHRLMEGKTAKRFEEAYHLFRRIEHTLQMMHESQTHELPADRDERVALALRCGFPDPLRFEDTLTSHREFVRREFETMFHETDAAENLTLVDYLLGENDPPAEIIEELAPAGIGTLEGFRGLQQLAVGSREFSPSARGKLGFVKLLPRVLEELPHVAMPDQAVRQFDLLLRAARGFTWVYTLCLSHPPILKMILRTLGFGSYLARLLIAHPEWLDEIFQSDGLKETRTERVLGEFPANADAQPPETTLRQLRVMKQREGFFIATQEVLAIASSEDAARRTTTLAEFVVEGATRAAAREVLDQDAASLPVRWAVIGLGGLGDGQVHLAGDLDLAFVIESDGPWRDGTQLLAVDRVCQRLIAHLGATTPEGQLWKVDARLRPDGANSPLVATADRFRQYYREEAGLWEWQALTKARPIAGDAAYGRELLDSLYAVFREIGPVNDLAPEILSMRKRMEENVKLPRNAQFDLKTGAGGIVDVEFLVQYHQLSRPGLAKQLFPLTTAEAITALEKRRAFSAEDAAFLREHLRLLRTIQRHLRLLWETTRDYFPADWERRLALRRGLADQLLADGLAEFDQLSGRLARMRGIFLDHLTR